MLGGSCRDDCFDVGRALEHEDGVFLGLESGSSDLGDADRHGNTEGRCEGNEAGTRWQVYIEPVSSMCHVQTSRHVAVQKFIISCASWR